MSDHFVMGTRQNLQVLVRHLHGEEQVIEEIYDGDTIKSLLQKGNLSLAKTVVICRSKEAAKKNQNIHQRFLQTAACVSEISSSQLFRIGGHQHSFVKF